jgi:hypothetical protein
METAPSWFFEAAFVASVAGTIWFARAVMRGELPMLLVAGLCALAAFRGLMWSATIVAGIVWPA